MQSHHLHDTFWKFDLFLHLPSSLHLPSKTAVGVFTIKIFIWGAHCQINKVGKRAIHVRTPKSGSICVPHKMQAQNPERLPGRGKVRPTPQVDHDVQLLKILTSLVDLEQVISPDIQTRINPDLEGFGVTVETFLNGEPGWQFNRQ